MERSAGPRSVWIAVMAALSLAGCGGGSMTPPPPPSFTLSASPSNSSIGQGGTSTSTITVIGHNGFNGSVSLSASGLPNGVVASFNPPSTATTSTLTLTASGTATLGNATVIAAGASGTLSQTANINLTVAAPSVTVSVSPKRAAVVATSQAQQFTATVTGNMGNPGVTWSVDGIANGNAAIGTVNGSGLYSPPVTAGTHTISATSVVLPTSSGSASVAVTDLAGVFTHHNNLSRDGSNPQEYALTASTVTPNTFGKLFSCAVDGAVYTQPLWVPGISIGTGGGIHNVVFVATQHDSLYAFDGDANPCVKYWKVNLVDTLHGGTTGEGTVPWQNVGFGYQDIQPEIGVTGTPVIDSATSTIYLVSKSENTTTGTFYQRLHALDLATGNEKFNAPALIAASVPGIGDGSSGGIISFNTGLQHQRSGLVLAAGRVYVAWAAHEDRGPYNGWLISYTASNVQQQVAVFNTTPNGVSGPDGGIWAGGGAPAVDSGGDVYFSTGNGVFDEAPPPPSHDYGDSILRLHPFVGSTFNGVNLNPVGWFTPFDQSTLAQFDTDLGSGAVVLLPDQTSGPTHLLAQLGKEGVVYLLDRDNMGGFQPLNNNQIVQYFFATGGGFWGAPAFWQNGLYFAGAGDSLKLFSFNPTTGLFNTNASSQSSQVYNYPGASPSVSSHGSANGIVWAVDASQYGVPAASLGPAVLHAYNAADLATEYWNSSMAANHRDQAGNAVKFVPPTVANGKVYLSTRTEVDVYGLLPN